MKLKAYLKQRQISIAQFGEAIGVTRQTVYRYINGEHRPPPNVMLAISRETSGMVMPNDFYPLFEPPASGDAA